MIEIRITADQYSTGLLERMQRQIGEDVCFTIGSKMNQPSVEELIVKGNGKRIA